MVNVDSLVQQGDPFFSIIIPAYNVMSYGMERCLNNIWNQGLDEQLYEVICVDDYSTDNTWEYLQQTALNHGNMRVFRHNENKRQGAARNTGIKSARGSYILFLDSDDYFAPDFLPQLYDKLNNSSLDVLVYDCIRTCNGREYSRLDLTKTQEIMNGRLYLQAFGIIGMACVCAFNRQYILDNNLFFYENVRFEDVEYTLRAHFLANRICYVPIAGIYYVQHPGQTTKTFSKDIFHDYSFIVKKCYEFYNTCGVEMQYIKYLITYCYVKNVIKYCCSVFADPEWKYRVLKDNLGEFKLADKKILLMQRHLRLLAYCSNLTPIPFCWARKLLNYRRRKKLWKPKWNVGTLSTSQK